MAATTPKQKIRTLRAYCVDTILKRVATYDVSEQQRQKGDAALMEGSGDGQLHRVTLLKALGRCELSRAFRGLPLTYAATRRFLVAAGPAKGAKVFDALRESADASSDLLAVESAEWLVDELMEAGKLKRERGPELVGAAKNAAKRAAKACRARRQVLMRPAPRETAAPSFAARDIRLDGVPQPPPTTEVDLAAFAEKCALRVHPDRRGALGDRAAPGRG